MNDEFKAVNEDSALVEINELKGMAYDAGAFLTLSSETTRDVDRWRVMPSLEQYSLLKKLDLYKQRYIKCLHDSVCDLTHLQVLSLVRCEKLTCLPDRIGRLKNLEELDLQDVAELSTLPESIGDLKSLRKLKIGGQQGSGNKLLKTLPSTIVKLSCLETLCLEKCKALASLPSDIGKMMNLKVLNMR